MTGLAGFAGIASGWKKMSPGVKLVLVGGGLGSAYWIYKKRKATSAAAAAQAAAAKAPRAAPRVEYLNQPLRNVQRSHGYWKRGPGGHYRWVA